MTGPLLPPSVFAYPYFGSRNIFQTVYLNLNYLLAISNSFWLLTYFSFLLAPHHCILFYFFTVVFQIPVFHYNTGPPTWSRKYEYPSILRRFIREILLPFEWDWAQNSCLNAYLTFAKDFHHCAWKNSWNTFLCCMPEIRMLNLV